MFGAICDADILENCWVSEQSRKDLSYSRNQIAILPRVTLTAPTIDTNSTTVFIHPPKTGGTNVDNLLKVIAVLSDRTEIRAYVPRVEGMSPNLFVSGKIGGLATFMANPELFDCENQTIGFISGHMPYPSHAFQERYFGHKKLNFIGTIRPPVSREISSANFDCQRGYADCADLERYVLDVPIDNLQTRFYAGQEFMVGPCNMTTLETAQRHIVEDFRFVIPLEDLDVGMAIVAHSYGYPNIAYAPMQVTGRKVLSSKNTSLIAALSDKHNYDQQLYSWARSYWETWKAAHVVINTELKFEEDQKESIFVLAPDHIQERNINVMTHDDIADFNQKSKDTPFVRLWQNKANQTQMLEKK